MKYMGSKNKISKYIVPILQKCIDNNNIENYYEFFVGGANIIDKIQCKNRIGTDKNKYLIELLKYVRDNNLDNLPNEILFEEYDRVRKSYRDNSDKYEDYYKGFIGFCGSYGNRFYDGGYARNSSEDITGERTKSAILNLKTQAPNLKGIKFSCKDYKDINIENVKNAVIYLDPPYKNVKQYDNSKDFDYDYFYDFCVRLKENGNFVFISELDIADNRFEKIWEMELKRGLQKQENNFKNKAVEKLFIVKENNK